VGHRLSLGGADGMVVRVEQRSACPTPHHHAWEGRPAAGGNDSAQSNDGDEDSLQLHMESAPEIWFLLRFENGHRLCRLDEGDQRVVFVDSARRYAFASLTVKPLKGADTAR
jgi:hypothetical protein